jgi:hypothetical protein
MNKGSGKKKDGRQGAWNAFLRIGEKPYGSGFSGTAER